MQLNSRQARAVYHVNGPMLVLAGPGSGKTHLLIERIVYLTEQVKVKPEDILVITFSKKAAAEMQQRFIKRVEDAPPVNFGTFHAVFFHIIQQYEHFSKDSILTPKDKREIIEDTAKRLKIKEAFSLGWQNQMLECVEKYKQSGELFVDEYEKMYGAQSVCQLRDVISGYLSACKELGKIDFDDMILNCRELLMKNESARKIWQNRYKYIMVDEFQDINDVQYDVLRLLAGERGNVFCVGDDDQSIYGFRGAKPEIMKRFLSDFANAKQIALEYNYRCKRNIVQCANAVISHNKSRMERECQKVIDESEYGDVVIREYVSAEEEAAGVVRDIKQKVSEGMGYYDFCILYRSARYASAVREHLRREKVPYILNEKIFSIYEVKEVMLIIAYMKIAVVLGSEKEWITIINHPARRISREVFAKHPLSIEKTLFEYYAQDGEMQRRLAKLKFDLQFIGNLPPYAAIVYILNGIGLQSDIEKSYVPSGLSAPTFEEVMEELKNKAKMFNSIRSFIESINYDIQPDEDKSLNATNDSNRISLMSAHASKGLEFNSVYMIGLREGVFPHNKNLHGIAVEEERRLFYVGMTRAKRELILCALKSNHGIRESRFVSEVKEYQSFIASNSALSRNSSNASATASYSSSDSM